MATVLISGANRGIGKALSKEFLEAGDTVIGTCRDLSLKDELEAELNTGKGRFVCAQLEVTNDASISHLLENVSEKFTHLDYLINNAGILRDANDMLSINRESLREVLEINTISPVMVTKAFLPLLKASPSSLVINISSVLGSITEQDAPGGLLNYAYNTSKTALNMMGKLMSQELQPSGIGVLLLHPGWVRTRMGGDEAPLSVSESAQGLLEVIKAFSPSQSGCFFGPDGNEIPW